MCIYPAPNFIWYYNKTGGSRQEWSTTAPVTEKTGVCSDSEKIYTSKLTLSRNSAFTDNTDTTVMFQCGAISITGAGDQLFTPASVDVRFAVQVTGSTLKNGADTVSGQLQVVSGVSKTLTCETSVSRPAATIVWYIGNQEKQRSNSTAFTFNPQNNDHNKQVYCKAFNTQPESQAAISYKSTLFVQERATVKSFYIGQNESQTVATIEEHDVNIPLTCVVSGMPASEIYVSFKGGIIARGSNTNKLQYNFGKIACTKSGVYICKGFDIFGMFTSRTVELFVECSPRPIRQVLHNITSHIGSSILLTFKVIAYPEPGPKGFKWFIEDRLNWISLLSNEDFQISSSGFETNLTISNASREHYGKYRVTAVNKVGSYDQIFFLSEKGITSRFFLIF
ncbi:limbic system-associated membrane protein-like [Ruditapes philippinarum]|uniref:limbic system-associated membrane protein-like n=1 Tax=Ruditapes philippinarum TaxID=129788 RepID=UPI00295AADE0|nr:limbic system-associated membrane protein-like [Ruditapes philippinarum]